MLAGTLGGFYSNDNSVGLDAHWRWGVYGSPSFTYFLRDRLGFGVLLSGDYRRSSNDVTGTYHEASLGFGVQLVYDVRLSERLSWYLWPSIEYHFARREQKYDDVTYSGYYAPTRLRQEIDYPRVKVFLPFVYHVSSSVGIGLGPFFYSEFAVHRESSPELVQGRSHREVMGVTSTIVASF